MASLVAVFGEFDISGDLEKKRSVTKNVKRIVVHREYDAATFENDLALLELESPIHYDTHIGELICARAIRNTQFTHSIRDNKEEEEYVNIICKCKLWCDVF